MREMPDLDAGPAVGLGPDIKVRVGNQGISRRRLRFANQVP